MNYVITCYKENERVWIYEVNCREIISDCSHFIIDQKIKNRLGGTGKKNYFVKFHKVDRFNKTTYVDVFITMRFTCEEQLLFEKMLTTGKFSTGYIWNRRKRR